MKSTNTLTIKGMTGKTIQVSGDSVRISQQFLGQNRDTVIPIRQINSIEVRRPGLFQAGFIRVVIAGATSSSLYSAISAANDPNAVGFARGFWKSNDANYETALAIQQYVLDRQGTQS